MNYHNHAQLAVELELHLARLRHVHDRVGDGIELMATRAEYAELERYFIAIFGELGFLCDDANTLITRLVACEV